MATDNHNALSHGTKLYSPRGMYIIRSVLGTGGFGITYYGELSMKVDNIRGVFPVAIKEFFPGTLCERADDDSMSFSNPIRSQVERHLEDFKHEAHRLNSLSGLHPNIVSVNEVFEANNTAYYVMEYLDGETLANHIKQTGAMSTDRMLEIMMPIVSAVAFLHSRHITHLDIKPANIMLADEEGSDKLRPVLIDFGLSKHYNSDGSATSIFSQSGYSPGFTPPEQYGGLQSFSPPSDVYALGATMLFLLTGTKLASSLELTAEDINRAIPDNISHGLYRVLLKSLSLRASERYANAAELYEALSDISGIIDTRFVAPPPAVAPVQPRLAPVSRRPRTSSHSSSKANMSRGQRHGKKPGNNWWIRVVALVTVAVIAGGIAWFLNSKVSDADQDDKKEVLADLGIDMVYVDGGNFDMGSNFESDEEPIHREHVNDFYIGRTEVTQRQWESVMGSNPSEFKDPDYPVTNVSWDACQEFMHRLYEKTGVKYRLPTEAEWEYAARGGKHHDFYICSGSNDIDKVGWINVSKPHTVATKSSNSLGLYDMSGNVWEWVQDYYSKDYSSPRNSSRRVIRGGGWHSEADKGRVADRGYFTPSNGYNYLGFRLAADNLSHNK